MYWIKERHKSKKNLDQLGFEVSNTGPSDHQSDTKSSELLEPG